MILKIPTGCEAIDRILDGGIACESLSLIYGEAETGKTTLALQSAINRARRGYKTLFVDCDGTFSVTRLSQMASREFKEISEMMILMKPSSFHEQTLIIDQLSGYINQKFGLLVFDTITSLYSIRIAELPGKTFELNRELNRQMALLAQTAKIQKIAILVTSQVRSAFNDAYVSIAPVATRVVKFWANTIILLKPTENPSVIKAIVEKNQKQEKPTQPMTCLLRIAETGIQNI